MIDKPFYLNCMDPGGTTGLGLLRIEPGRYETIEQAIVPHRPEVSTAIDKLRDWRHRYSDAEHVMIFENFHVRPQRAIPDTTALLIIGELEAWAYGLDPNLTKAVALLRAARALSHGSAEKMISEAISLLPESARTGEGPYRLVVAQEPVQAKNLVTDEILLKTGLLSYGPFSVHVNDAHRHAVTWLALMAYMPVCTRGWPQP